MLCFFSAVNQDVKSTDEEGLKRKEQSILKLGTLLQQQVYSIAEKILTLCIHFYFRSIKCGTGTIYFCWIGCNHAETFSFHPNYI